MLSQVISQKKEYRSIFFPYKGLRSKTFYGRNLRRDVRKIATEVTSATNTLVSYLGQG